MNDFIASATRTLDEPIDRARYLVVGNARWKRSVFLYPPGASEPSVVVKVPTNDEAQRQCDVEHRALTSFALRDVPGVCAPRPLAEMPWRGYRCYFQEVLSSRQWLSRLPLRSGRLRWDDFRRATEHLVAIYRATRQAELEPGRSYAKCYQHGDFWLGNLGTDRSRLVLYDFEYAVPDGKPLFDLLHFALYYQVALRNVGKVGRDVATGRYDRRLDQRVFAPNKEDVHKLFIDPGHARTVVLGCLRRYRADCELAVEDTAALIRDYVETDRGIQGLHPGWEAEIV